jgi:uncharacterized membrane protein
MKEGRAARIGDAINLKFTRSMGRFNALPPTARFFIAILLMIVIYTTLMVLGISTTRSGLIYYKGKLVRW